jgi:predicted nucleic acid-binding protein
LTEIIDASVAAKWFVRGGEPGLAEADRVLGAVIEAPDHFAAPSLLTYELVAILCRRLSRPADVEECIASYLALGVPLVEMDERLARDAIALSFTHRLTGYDATYVAVARHLGGVWLTFDREAHRRVTRLHVTRLLG